MSQDVIKRDIRRKYTNVLLIIPEDVPEDFEILRHLSLLITIKSRNIPWVFSYIKLCARFKINILVIYKFLNFVYRMHKIANLICKKSHNKNQISRQELKMPD